MVAKPGASRSPTKTRTSEKTMSRAGAAARKRAGPAAERTAFIGLLSSETVLTVLVPNAVPVTAGSPYSRHTIAAWLMIPPTSVTVAAILPNTAPSWAR